MRSSTHRYVGRNTPGRGKSRYQSLLFGRVMFGVSRDVKEASAAGIEKRGRLAGAHASEVIGSQVM